MEQTMHKVRELFSPGMLSSADGYIRLESSEGVIGYQSVEKDSAVFALPAQPAKDATRLYSAQFASGPAGEIRYFTELNLINTAEDVVTIEVLLVDNGGIPVESSINSPYRSGTKTSCPSGVGIRSYMN